MSGDRIMIFRNFRNYRNFRKGPEVQGRTMIIDYDGSQNALSGMLALVEAFLA